LTAVWMTLPSCDDLMSTGSVLVTRDVCGENRVLYRVRVRE
jgi:hypothetical protein